MRPNIYVTLHNVEFDLSSLSGEETTLFQDAKAASETATDWLAFRQKWMNLVLSLYDKQQIPRREAVEKPLYRVVQDLGSRLMVQAGLAKLPSYQEQIAEIIEKRFKTRREFCDVTGLSEDLLSHVLKGRKDVSISNLTEALAKIGYGLAIVPLQAVAANVPRRATS